MGSLKLAIAQLDPVVGDFDHNIRLIREAYRRACGKGARVLLTPELGVCGYPPHDLLERPEMLERTEVALGELALLTQGQTCALVVGHVSGNPAELGKSLLNSVSVFEGGRRVFTQSKRLLPTYDIFDESRYFEPAREIALWDCDGHSIALAICEDLWGQDVSRGRRLYREDPVDDYEKAGADLVISLSSSPYEWAKQAHRELIHKSVAQRLGVPVLYVNQTGATDEILFDGASFVTDARGK